MVETRKTNHVFCIKPNEHKQKKVLEMALVQHQVRYMSLMPLVALWRSGHCYHINHSKFLQRYKMLNADTWPHYRGGSVVEGIAVLIRKLPLPHAEFTIGTRKVFIRSPRTVMIKILFVIGTGNLLSRFRCTSSKSFDDHVWIAWHVWFKPNSVVTRNGKSFSVCGTVKL